MQMIRFERKITREQYQRAVANRGYVVRDDQKDILTDAERLGYGGTADKVFERDGEFFAHCSMWDSCD